MPALIWFPIPFHRALCASGLGHSSECYDDRSATDDDPKSTHVGCLPSCPMAKAWLASNETAADRWPHTANDFTTNRGA